MKNLAINGGSKVISEPFQFPRWPQVYPETAERLKDIYLNQTWSFYGPRERAFNEMFAKYNNVKHGILMANGTVTLEVALKTLNVKAGDEVIVPAHTWMATGTAVAYVGAIPVIVDIDPDTLCMDPDAFEAAITPKTRAVIPVHLFGGMADMDKIMEIARKHNLAVIEDCAHSHGAQWDGKFAGSIGDIGSFSFQQSKVIAAGEGGACTTNSDEYAEKLGRLSHIGYPFASQQGQVVEPPPAGLICHNYRVTEFQAEILISQLEHLAEDNALRAERAGYLRKRLNAIPGLKVQAPGRKTTLPAYYSFAMKLDPTVLKPGLDRSNVIEALRAEGLNVTHGWGNVMYKHHLWTIPAGQYRVASCENAERIIYKELMQMPLQWLMLNEEQTSLIADAFEKVMKAYQA